MKKIIKLCALIAVAAILTGCVSESASLETRHGMAGKLTTPWGELDMTPSILQDGESALQSEYDPTGGGKDMPSTYTSDAAGNIRATGFAAYIAALRSLCATAPMAKLCGGGAAFE